MDTMGLQIMLLAVVLSRRKKYPLTTESWDWDAILGQRRQKLIDWTQSKLV